MMQSYHQIILYVLEKIVYNKIMTIDDQIKDEKIQSVINTEAAKLSTLSSGKINKYEYLTVEEILPSEESRTIEQVKFTNENN